MKAFLRTIIITSMITLFAAQGFSQINPPNGGHGQDGNQPPAPSGGGGGAPIGSGLFILLGLGAAYASKGVFTIKKEDLES